MLAKRTIANQRLPEICAKALAYPLWPVRAIVAVELHYRKMAVSDRIKLLSSTRSHRVPRGTAYLDRSRSLPFPLPMVTVSPLVSERFAPKAKISQAHRE